MASNIFWYSPTTGAGNANVTISAATTNTGETDRSAVIALTNGVVTVSVNVVQRYRPYYDLRQGSTIPATGGSVDFYMHTEYPIVFRSIPDWITVKLGQRTIITGAEPEIVSVADADGSMFSFVAGPNTGAARSDNMLNIGHYIDGTLASYKNFFSINQEAAEGIATDVNEVVFDYNQTTGGSFNVITNQNWTSTITDN